MEMAARVGMQEVEISKMEKAEDEGTDGKVKVF